MERHSRFAKLEYRRVGALSLPVARGRIRLLGLALLDRNRAGPGLIIPHCHAIHTHGMRFPLHVAFLSGRSLRRLVLGVKPGQFLSTPGTDLVIELVPRDGDDLDSVRALLEGARGAVPEVA